MYSYTERPIHQPLADDQCLWMNDWSNLIKIGQCLGGIEGREPR